MISSLEFFFIGILIAPTILTLMRPYEQQVILMWLRSVWPLLRPLLGWLFLALGVLGIILPILQGVLFLLIGVALVGRRNRVIRRIRVAYRLSIRQLAHSRRPALRWIGQHARHAMFRLLSKQHALRRRRHEHQIARRRFRVAIVPPPSLAVQLNIWRQRYDPGWRYGLPPHIIVIAASRTPQRQRLEHALSQICQQLSPFQISLEPPLLLADAQRVGCPVAQGREHVCALRSSIAELAIAGLRFSQRQGWPALTLAKIKRTSSLSAAHTQIRSSLNSISWRTSELVLFEERFGHLWYRVRTFPLGNRQ